MTVYIEYAFLENFLYDGVLLSLALTAAKVRLRWTSILFSACLGGVFALVFPFIRLTKWLDVPLKFAAGGLLCLLAHGRVKTKKEWGRYALTCVLFFGVSFGFGGALVACSGGSTLQKVPAVAVFFGFAIMTAVTLLLCKKLYKKRAIHAFIYDCEIAYQGQRIRLLGFLDSGNAAEKNGVPVCFVAPDIFYELWGETVLSKASKEELVIVTMSGERKLSLQKGQLRVKTNGEWIEKKEAYFACGGNIVSREYKMLLNARTLEG